MTNPAVDKWLKACADILREQPDIIEACEQLGLDPLTLRLLVSVPSSDGFVEGGIFKSALDGLGHLEDSPVEISEDGSADPLFVPNVVSFESANDPLKINADPMLVSRTGFMAPGPQDEE